MSIGTAKPTAEEMDGVKHYFIDSLSITDSYNVGKYETEVITLLEELFKKHEQVIIVGGSGLYINAICNGIDNLPEADTATRKKVENILKTEGIASLQKLLKSLDPTYYEKVDKNNPQRLSRAVEVCLSTGKTYSSLRTGTKIKRNFNIIKIGLNSARDLLYERINARVDIMMQNGLLNEVEALLPNKHLNALQTVGYKELFSYLEKEIDLETAVGLIKQNTRRFAKRQLTWFRKDEDIEWFQTDEVEAIVKNINNKLQQAHA